mmetsp:Transcript_5314/g.12932  ORF Transcript_5314/g.12932 Transcript_5314/m.12932 type:complete len:200 (+) Transcript_5314:956-1555(+)
MLTPRSAPMDSSKVIYPDSTNVTSMTDAADEDDKIAVTRIPVNIPRTRFLHIVFSTSRISSPAPALRLNVILPIPYMNNASPPAKLHTSTNQSIEGPFFVVEEDDDDPITSSGRACASATAAAAVCATAAAAFPAAVRTSLVAIPRSYPYPLASAEMAVWIWRSTWVQGRTGCQKTSQKSIVCDQVVTRPQPKEFGGGG